MREASDRPFPDATPSPGAHRRAHTSARELEPGLAAAATEAATASWSALRCEGFVRVDVLAGDDGPQVIEANAVPGLTDTSLFPMAAEAAGLSFEAACERIVELGIRRAGAPALG